VIMALPRRVLAVGAATLAVAAGGGAAIAATHGSSSTKPATKAHTARTSPAKPSQPHHSCPNMGSSTSSSSGM
jgi:hypothetical protein